MGTKPAMIWKSRGVKQNIKDCSPDTTFRVDMNFITSHIAPITIEHLEAELLGMLSIVSYITALLTSLKRMDQIYLMISVVSWRRCKQPIHYW